MCQEFCSQGSLPQCMLGYHTPPAPRSRLPPEQAPPRSRHPPAQCMLRETVNKWAVCILLECNLVPSYYLEGHLFYFSGQNLWNNRWPYKEGSTAFTAQQQWFDWNKFPTNWSNAIANSSQTLYKCNEMDRNDLSDSSSEVLLSSLLVFCHGCVW